MARHRYQLYGLRLSSEIPLHAPPAGPGRADLVIHAGAPRKVPARPAEGELLCKVRFGTGGAAHVRTANGYTLRYYKTAEFELSPDLRQVTAYTDPRAAVDLAPEFLTASVPAFVRLLTGHTVLHASVVERHGHALGVMAPSGGGKSTIAAALCAGGFAPVTDDALVFDWQGDTPLVRRGPGEIRLRSRSVALAKRGGVVKNTWPARSTADGRTAVRAAALNGTITNPELKALVVPELRNGGATELIRLESGAALAAILGHLRVVGWKDTPALQALFPEQVRLARQVPVYRLSLPRGAGALPRAVQLLSGLPGLTELA